MAVVNEDEQVLREMICKIGARLWKRELIAANDGNISVRLKSTTLLCTPSGISKGFLQPNDLVVTDLEGEKVSGSLNPSSELKMHVEIYRHRQDVGAVVHAHPPNATAFAVARLEIPRYVMPEIDVLLGAVPLIPYQTPGTQRLADAVGASAGAGVGQNALLLGNHGAVTCGATLEIAWLRMESLDQCCRILLLSRGMGGWKLIDEEKREELDELRARA